MARKVFISFLGNNDYFPVFYGWGPKDESVTSHQTKFIQEAILTQLCKKKFGENDCIMIFRTEESNMSNWLDNEEKGKKGLKSVIENIPGCKCIVNPEKDPNEDSYIIPTGFTKDDIWKIFQIVFEKLQEGDKVYFDVTHAFRTIPMFANVLFDYARYLKNTDVKAIYYGAFETLGSVQKLKSLPDAEKTKLKAPIVDLISIVRLQKINVAASSFRDFGNLSVFSDLLKRNTIGMKKNNSELLEMAEALADLDLYIQTCRLEDIEKGEYMEKIINSVKGVQEHGHVREPHKVLLRSIISALEEKGFTKLKSYGNVEAAIEWAIDHKMIQQALTLATEYIVTRVTEDIVIPYGFDELLSQSKSRQMVGQSKYSDSLRTKVRSFLAAVGVRNWRDVISNKKVVDSYGEVLERSPLLKQVATPFKRINDFRNNLNHAGTTKDKTDTLEGYQQRIKRYWTEIKTVFNEI